jgi:hypothetical protein
MTLDRFSTTKAIFGERKVFSKFSAFLINQKLTFQKVVIPRSVFGVLGKEEGKPHSHCKDF